MFGCRGHTWFPYPISPASCITRLAQRWKWVGRGANCCRSDPSGRAPPFTLACHDSACLKVDKMRQDAHLRRTEKAWIEPLVHIGNELGGGPCALGPQAQALVLALAAGGGHPAHPLARPGEGRKSVREGKRGAG